MPCRAGSHSRVWDHVPATRAQIAGVGRELLRCQVQVVTLESSVGLLADLVLRAGERRAGGPAGGLPSQAKNLKGRPKTDKLDAMWLARLTQWGVLPPCFVPPAEIRRVRDFTRARTDLVPADPVPGSGWRSCSRTP